jgi:hypothetical protein
VLGTLNLVFLLIGSAIVALAGVMRWGNFDLNKIIHDENVQSLVGITSVDSVSLALLILGAAILFTSVLGLLGVCCTSRFFLTMYEIVIGLLFVSHLILFVILVAKRGDLEEPYAEAVDRVVAEINSFYPMSASAQAKCDLFRLVSKLGQCCGAKGPEDFGITAQRACCHVIETKSANQTGCTSATIDFFKNDFLKVVIIPNAAVLAFEAAVLLIVPCLIARFSRHHHH